MSLVQLESFVAVAEEQHVGRAAKRLHISQPPLTRRIRGLEDELGAALFERTPRGMRLLPTGEVLLPRARRILAEVEQLRSTIVAASVAASVAVSRDRAGARARFNDPAP